MKRACEDDDDDPSPPPVPEPNTTPATAAATVTATTDPAPAGPASTPAAAAQVDGVPELTHSEMQRRLTKWSQRGPAERAARLSACLDGRGDLAALFRTVVGDSSAATAAAAAAPAAAAAAPAFTVRRVVTTTDHVAEHRGRARALAETLKVHFDDALYVERAGDSLVRILAKNAADAVLVVGVNGTLVRLSNGAEHKLHGAMGVVRMRNVSSGGSDNMVEACGLRAGDSFLDATAGQLSDALVAAHVVGPEGRVTAIEASPLLHAVSSGRPVRTGDKDGRVDELLGSIDVVLGEHTEVLRGRPDGSADVVYFDPMFRRPQKSAGSFDVLRALAHAAPLTEEAVAQARRVARRRVVVMDASGGAELERLGLTVVHTGQRKRYGVIDLESAAGAAAVESGVRDQEGAGVS